MTHTNRGFASTEEEKRLEITSKGGKVNGTNKTDPDHASSMNKRGSATQTSEAKQQSDKQIRQNV